ncbi:suppressor of fused domain protein [Mesorhizobium sp. AR07]|uniref:suppressor of fused domain protein n=1 Tax=Mesorhizobium sp. AR07 TaxID=2865838 RepID=UPI002160D7C7|nr:suppressor of fused domain protein [Mesorhizobium sp. AR07]UVK46526.1 suppressor of fused domain protein [Mesorhizobium sp. AR07]
MSWIDKIENHYEIVWKSRGEICEFTNGPIDALPEGFTVRKFRPHAGRDMWTFATCGMSLQKDKKPIELHIFSPKDSVEIVELLFSAAHFHRTAEFLGLWHTVNFGRSWLDDSLCTHGLVSLPYLDGPLLENLELNSFLIKFYWLIPISPSEVEFKKANGLEALEAKFEQANFNYIDPRRRTVV